MGAAKRKRQNRVPTVYHHTSTLRTNLIWMSGVIEVEGKSKGVFHPSSARSAPTPRCAALKDFPPVAWFTTRIDVPRVLIGSEIVIVDQGTARNWSVENRMPISPMRFPRLDNTIGSKAYSLASVWRCVSSPFRSPAPRSGLRKSPPVKKGDRDEFYKMFKSNQLRS